MDQWTDILKDDRKNSQYSAVSFRSLARLNHLYLRFTAASPFSLCVPAVFWPASRACRFSLVICRMAATQSLIYSFVARGKTVLAEYSVFAGNFSQVAVQCLDRLQPENKKASYSRDGFSFNFLTDNNFTYCVVTEEGFSRAVSFAFLNRIRDDFMAKFTGGKAESAYEHSMDRQYGPILKKEMEFCEQSPGEVEKVAGLRQQVAEVKNVMLSNIDAVMSRGVKMETLEDQAGILRDEAQRFQDNGRRIRSKMWYENMRTKALVIGIIIVVGLIIWLSVCHGFTCSSGSSPAAAATSNVTPSPPFVEAAPPLPATGA